MTEEDEEFERIKRRIELETLPLINFTKQKEWVDLTEDEAFACKKRDYFETHKAIEAKLKEKNYDRRN